MGFGCKHFGHDLELKNVFWDFLVFRIILVQKILVPEFFSTQKAQKIYKFPNTITRISENFVFWCKHLGHDLGLKSAFKGI